MNEDVVLAAVNEDIERQIDSNSLLECECLEPCAMSQRLLLEHLASRGDGTLSCFNPVEDTQATPAVPRAGWWWLSDSLRFVDHGSNNLGWETTTDVRPGTLLAVCSPVLVHREGAVRGATSPGLHLLNALYQELKSLRGSQMERERQWLLSQLAELHPRRRSGRKTPLKREGKSEDAQLANIKMKLKTELQGVDFLSEGAWTAGDEVKRLQECVRCNSIGIYQNAEQFSHTCRYAKYNGVGLYGCVASRFNHSCCPNVTRVFLGNLIFFRTTTRVPEGSELCVSYLESESLVDPYKLRQKVLAECWGFTCSCVKCFEEKKQRKKPTRLMEIFGEELRSYVAQLSMEERHSALVDLEELAVRQLGPSLPVPLEHWLRLVSERGFVEMQLYRWTDAYASFSRCLDRVQRDLGKYDEAVVTFSFHMARCSAAQFLLAPSNHNLKWKKRGLLYLSLCFRVHRILFGGDDLLFVSRFQHEWKGEFRTAHAAVLNEEACTLDNIKRHGMMCAVAGLLHQWFSEVKMRVAKGIRNGNTDPAFGRFLKKPMPSELTKPGKVQSWLRRDQMSTKAPLLVNKTTRRIQWKQSLCLRCYNRCLRRRFWGLVQVQRRHRAMP